MFALNVSNVIKTCEFLKKNCPHLSSVHKIFSLWFVNIFRLNSSSPADTLQSVVPPLLSKDSPPALSDFVVYILRDSVKRHHSELMVCPMFD